jgi:hypothetical protein
VSTDEDPGFTTEIAPLVDFLLGALTQRNTALAAGLAVGTAILLAGRDRLHVLVRDTLSERELHGAGRFVAGALNASLGRAGLIIGTAAAGFADSQSAAISAAALKRSWPLGSASCACARALAGAGVDPRRCVGRLRHHEVGLTSNQCRPSSRLPRARRWSGSHGSSAAKRSLEPAAPGQYVAGSSGDDGSAAGNALVEPRGVALIMNHPVARHGRVKAVRRGDDDSSRTAHDSQRIAGDQLVELHIAGAAEAHVEARHGSASS